MTATETRIALIRKGRGILKRRHKRQPGEKPFDEEWALHRREEINFEQQWNKDVTRISRNFFEPRNTPNTRKLG